MASRRLYLVDGTALAYRSFFAFIRNPLTNSRGLNTSAVYGFTQALTRLMDAEPDGVIAVAWDHPSPTFRHAEYGEYKATRQKMPDEMKAQLPYVEAVVRAYGLPFLSVAGYEADDIIGTLATQAAKDGWRVAIVAADKDFMQLVGERIALWIPRPAGDFEKLGADGVKQRAGVPPERITDLLGLMGDSSDNVPGVRGVGEKTAKDLLQQFDTLEDALARADECKSKKLAEKLKAGAEDARLSKRLVTIDTHAPIGLPDAATRGEPDREKLAELYAELEFKALLRTVTKAEEHPRRAAEVVAAGSPMGGLVRELGGGQDLVVQVAAGPGIGPERPLCGIAFALPASTRFVPVEMEGGSGTALEELRAVLEDERTPKGAHDAKEGMALLARRGVRLRGLSFDTMLASYLMDPAQRAHGLDDLAARHLGIRRVSAGTEGSGQPGLFDEKREDVAERATRDAELVARLHRFFEPQLHALGVAKLYRELELPLVPVLVEMELRGVKVDASLLSDLARGYERRLAALEAEIHGMAGGPFNVNSPKQLGPILFEKLRIQEPRGGGKGARVRRTKTGYSTDADVLVEYAAHPIVAKLLEYRNLGKLKSTYLDALPLLVSPADGRIHTSYNQAVAATGRLSSSDPNLQNIPIRTEEGRQIRRAFVAEDGSVLLSADYSQIELRILAHLTRDPTLIDVYRADRDVHTETAARVFGVRPQDVTLELRSRAKVINFGIVYGMGPQRVARETGLSLPEAKAFIETYFATYPGVKRFIDETLEKARTTGSVETLLGRRRAIPEINSSNGMLRNNAENAAINTPIQGSAADLIKLAMIRLHARLLREGRKAAMILQVHDELVLEVPRSELADVERIVREEMEGCIELAVPLRVDMGRGKSWLEAHA